MPPEDATDRDLVREAFERTQEPPSPRLARRVSERVDEERRRARSSDGGWLLTLAGGVLVLALVGAFLVNAGDLPWPTGGAITPMPEAGTLGQPLPVGGAGQPTFLLPAADGAWPRLDWTGRRIGALTLPEAGGGLAVSPDGALVALRAPDGLSADVVDGGGRLVARLEAFGAWSGDGAHAACALGGAGIVLADLRGAAPRIASRPVAAGALAGPGWSLLGCSLNADVLVAAREDGTGALAEVEVVRLSSGRLVSRVAYAAGEGPIEPVLSPDARLLAENDAARPVAGIRDLLSGAVVGHVTGAVTAFSGDDRLVLLDSELDGPSAGSRTTLVDWRWNRRVWSAAGHAEPLAARPGGTELVVSLVTAGADAPRTLLLEGGGRAVDLDPAARPPSASAA